MDFLEALADDLYKWLKIGKPEDYSIDAAVRALVFLPWGFGYKNQWDAGWWWLLAASVLCVCTLCASLILTIPLSMLHAYAIEDKGR